MYIITTREVGTLDALLRGSIERFLDDVLEKENLLENAAAMFRKPLAPTTKHIEDALFGYVVGRLLQLTFDSIQIHYRRNPTDAEFQEIGRILERRAMEIKSKVTLVANR